MTESSSVIQIAVTVPDTRLPPVHTDNLRPYDMWYTSQQTVVVHVLSRVQLMLRRATEQPVDEVLLLIGGALHR